MLPSAIGILGTRVSLTLLAASSCERKGAMNGAVVSSKSLHSRELRSYP